MDRRVFSPTGVDALLTRAEHEVLVMGTGATPLRRVDHENLRRGVRYRLVLPFWSRASVSAVRGVLVRTTGEAPIGMTVVDREAVVLPARDGPAVFRLPSVVTTSVELFERTWCAGAPLAAADPPEHAELSDRERELLTLLSSGSTDENAGARLGVSVRTVRRTMAEIMSRLGARSRFEAGAKAADRGWLVRAD